MIIQVSEQFGYSVRRICCVLGIRRQTYYRRKKGNLPQDREEELIGLLQGTCQRFVAWGFWMVFYFLRNEHNLTDNHKRVYRLWKEAGLHLRVAPKRPGIRREYKELLVPKQMNQGWAMDFVSDWVVGSQKQAVLVIKEGLLPRLDGGGTDGGGEIGAYLGLGVDDGAAREESRRR